MDLKNFNAERKGLNAASSNNAIKRLKPGIDGVKPMAPMSAVKVAEAYGISEATIALLLKGLYNDRS